MRHRLQVAESVTEVNGTAILGISKSHHCRSVPLPRSLVDDLALYVAGKALDERTFTTPDGGLLRLMNFDAGCSTPPPG